MKKVIFGLKFFFSVVIVSILINIFWYRLTHRKTIFTGADENKFITIYRPPFAFWSSEVYIMPYDYNGFFAPDKDFVSLTPMHDQSLYVNWHPGDGSFLKISLPYCNQKFENKLDSVSIFSLECFKRNYLDNKEDITDRKFQSKYSVIAYDFWAEGR